MLRITFFLIGCILGCCLVRKKQLYTVSGFSLYLERLKKEYELHIYDIEGKELSYRDINDIMFEIQQKR